MKKLILCAIAAFSLASCVTTSAKDGSSTTRADKEFVIPTFDFIRDMFGKTPPPAPVVEQKSSK